MVRPDEVDVDSMVELLTKVRQQHLNLPTTEVQEPLTIGTKAFAYLFCNFAILLLLL